MKKILTMPSECVFPTQDNVEGNLVVSKGDYIVKSEEMKYIVIELLGTGTFGQVFRCFNNFGDEVAIKVMKSINKYFQYEMNEVRILKRIKEKNLTDYFVELYDAFIYKQHLCIVIELLGKNMYDILRIIRFKGFGFSFIKPILKQILEALHELQNQGIVHCDLKPENIVLQDYFNPKMKIIDFGSSSTKTMSNVFYIQSRFYRAPEVILAIPYSSSIDIWSFGCIAYEFLMGVPLFPGSSNSDQILKINKFFNNGLPLFMLEHGEHTNQYFEKENGYKPIQSTNGCTMKEMTDKIRLKHGYSTKIDLYIDLILKALNPSYLEREIPINLLKHPFFEIDVDSSQDAGADRAMAPAQSLDNLKNRKMSMFVQNSFDNTDQDYFNDRRKGSVYDHNNQFR